MIPSLDEELSIERLVWRMCQVSEELAYRLEVGVEPEDNGDNDGLMTNDFIIHTTLRTLFDELDQLGIELTTDQMEFVEDNYRIGLLVTLRERFDGGIFSEQVKNLNAEQRERLDELVQMAEDGTAGDFLLLGDIIGTFNQFMPMSISWQLLGENMDLFVGNDKFTSHCRAVLDATPEPVPVTDQMVKDVQANIQDFIKRRDRFGAALKFLNNIHALLSDDEVEKKIAGYDRDKLTLLTSAGILPWVDDAHHKRITHHFEYYEERRIPLESVHCMEILAALYSAAPYEELDTIMAISVEKHNIPFAMAEFMRQMTIELGDFDRQSNYPLPTQPQHVEDDQ